jgi:hypothetical protein
MEKSSLAKDLENGQERVSHAELAVSNVNHLNKILRGRAFDDDPGGRRRQGITGRKTLELELELPQI